MNLIKSVCAAALLASLGSGAFGATVTATAIAPGVSDFEIYFTDLNNDNLLEYGEIDGFTGMVAELATFEFVYTTPDIDGISTFGSFSSVSDPSGPIDFWVFRVTGPSSSGSNPNVAAWTYQITLDTSDPPVAVVPLPATLPLLAGALGFFGFAARRKSKSRS